MLHSRQPVVESLYATSNFKLEVRRFSLLPFVALMEVFRMPAEAQQAEYPYCVKIEVSTGQSADVPIAFLTRQQVEKFIQFDFKRLMEEAGVKGARIHVERAITADYDKVLGDIAACLRTASPKVA